MAKNTKNRAGGGKSCTPGDYEVGWGKPPDHGRFPPGVSGNPRGRPAGSRNFKTMLKELLFREMVIKEKGEERTVSTLEALVLRHMQGALQGDTRARKDLLDWAERHLGAEVSTQEVLDEADQENLDRMVGRYRGATGAHAKRRSRSSKPAAKKAKGGDDHA